MLELDYNSDDMTFRQWAIANYNEVKSKLNPCNVNGELDPIRLNEVIITFGSNFAWAITLLEIETNNLNIAQTEYNEWFKGRWESATRSISMEREGTRAPSADSVKARITLTAQGEVESKQKALDKQKSRVDLLKGFVKVLDKQAGMLQTLSSNMRSEAYYAAGIPITSPRAGDSPSTVKIRRITESSAEELLSEAMNGT